MNNAIIGIYDHEESLVSSLKKIVEKKIEVNDVFTPYPVHEVFKILKRKTGMPYATFAFAILGLVISYTYIYWASVISYPLIYGGKPLHSMPSFIIIGFVSMISLAVLLSFIAFLIRTRLYPGKKPVIHDRRITDNAFVILINKNQDMTDDDIDIIDNLMMESGAIETFKK